MKKSYIASLLFFSCFLTNLKASEQVRISSLPAEIFSELIHYLPVEDRLRLRPTCQIICRDLDKLHEGGIYLEELVFSLIQKKQYGLFVLRPEEPEPQKRRDTLEIIEMVETFYSDFKVPSSLQELQLMCEGKEYSPWLDHSPRDMFGGAKYTFWLFMYGVRDGFIPLIRYSLGHSKTFNYIQSHPVLDILTFLKKHPKTIVSTSNDWRIPAAWKTIPLILNHNRLDVLELLLEDPLCSEFLFNLWNQINLKPNKIPFSAFNTLSLAKKCLDSEFSPEIINQLKQCSSFSQAITGLAKAEDKLSEIGMPEESITKFKKFVSDFCEGHDKVNVTDVVKVCA